jgi:predicted DNA binding protein
MREFVFDIEYDRGAAAVMDAFLDHPELRSEALLCCPDGDRLWRVERLVAPEVVLEDLRPRLTGADAVPDRDRDRDREFLGESACDCEQFHEAVDAAADRLVVFSYLSGVGGCVTVPTLAARLLDGGLLFHVEAREGVRQWRLLMQDDQKVGLLYDALAARLRDGLRFRFEHVGAATGWEGRLFPGVALPSEQLTTLEAALERGYYETPREITLDELAADLGVPRSTVSYRLRQAEARLVESHVDRHVRSRS